MKKKPRGDNHEKNLFIFDISLFYFFECFGIQFKRVQGITERFSGSDGTCK